MNAALVRVRLAQLNMSAIALARKVGVSHTTLSLWMRGHYPVPAGYWKSLASALSLSIEQVFGNQSTTITILPNDTGDANIKGVKLKEQK